MSSHQYLDDINYSTPNELDEVTKIQYYVDNIRSQAKIEMILEIFMMYFILIGLI